MIPYQLLYRIIGLSVLLFSPSTECKKVHELMTDDEITHVFQTSRDKVPEYEVVAIEHSLHKRSVPRDVRFKFNAFGEDVQAYLDPTDGILVGENTPVWIARNNENRTYYQQLKPGIMKEVLGIYQGRFDRAAFVVSSRKGRDLRFHGTIKDLTVIPLPDRVEEELDQIEKRRGNLSRITRELENERRHIVFKSQKGNNENPAIPKLEISTTEKNKETLKQYDTNNSEKAPWTVFPTILVTTDFNITVNSNDDTAYYDQILYQLAFWNGVDLLYRQFDKPKIRLRISALIIGSDRSATPYLKSNTVDGKLDIYAAFIGMKKYWGEMKNSEKFLLGAYHVVATVTNLRTLPLNRSGITVQVAGRASGAAICEENLEEFRQSFISTDYLGFNGITTAAHELAHILGVFHDNSRRCPSDDSYIMSPNGITMVNDSIWSACSLDYITKFLRTRHCVDKPKEYYPLGKRLQRVLPGTLTTINEQCQARGYDGACEATPEICRDLKCYRTPLSKKNVRICRRVSSAVEGTECAPGSYCIDRKCLPIHEESLEAGVTNFGEIELPNKDYTEAWNEHIKMNE